MTWKNLCVSYSGDFLREVLRLLNFSEVSIRCVIFDHFKSKCWMLIENGLIIVEQHNDFHSFELT